MDSQKTELPIDVIQLRQMSYHHLQAYAKTLNIRGNMKASKLIDAILKKTNQHEVEIGCDEPSDEEVAKIVQAKPQVVVSEDLAKTPAAISKVRRRTYELTPETTKVLDIDTAKDVAITNPFDAPKEITPKVVEAQVKKSRIPVKDPMKRRACPTPNFKKLHEREFNKMDSIDVYFAKKQARHESHRQAYQKSVKSIRTLGSRLDKQSPVASGSEFKPTVLSTVSMNLVFAKQEQNQKINGRLPKPRAAKKIAFTPAKSPFKFVGAPKKADKPPTPKPPVRGKIRPTFRYQPPKQSNKNAVDGNVGIGRRESQVDKERTILKGVRLNKRFQLQLQSRGLVIN